MLKREIVLPIGSVITLIDDNDHKYMIIGYYPIMDGTLFDYSAVQYPLGNATAETALLLNSDKIESVLFEGFKNEAYPLLLDALDAAAEKMETESKMLKLL